MSYLPSPLCRDHCQHQEVLSSSQEIWYTDDHPNNNTVVRWPCLFYQNGSPLIFQFSLLMSSFLYRSIRFYFHYCPPRNWCLPTTISCFDNLSSYTILLFLSLCSLFGFKWVPSKYSRDYPTKLWNGKNTILPKPHSFVCP